MHTFVCVPIDLFGWLGGWMDVDFFYSFIFVGIYTVRCLSCQCVGSTMILKSEREKIWQQKTNLNESVESNANERPNRKRNDLKQIHSKSIRVLSSRG